MKATEMKHLEKHIERLIFGIPKRLRTEYLTDIKYICSLFDKDPDHFFQSRQGKHWQDKKQVEAYSIHWRSTEDVQILKLEDAAKCLGLTSKQLAYRCSKGSGRYGLTKYNPEIATDDIVTVTRLYLPPGQRL